MSILRLIEENACGCCRYCAGTTPWGNPTGTGVNFEPQRHDDGYLEVIGFTSASLVSPAITLDKVFCYILTEQRERVKQVMGSNPGQPPTSSLGLMLTCITEAYVFYSV